MELKHLKAATVSLPERLNHETLRIVHHELQEFASSSCKVLLLSGSESCFCRGMDFSALGNGNSSDSGPKMFADLLYMLYRMPKLVVAVIDGEAIGGGVGIAASADYALATERASFSLPEAVFALSPAICFPLLRRRMREQKLRAWSLSASRIEASQALEWQLIDKLVSVDEIGPTIQKILRDSNRIAEESIAMIKQNKSTTHDRLREELDNAVITTATALQTDSAKKRIKAWQQGDAPWLC